MVGITVEKQNIEKRMGKKMQADLWANIKHTIIRVTEGPPGGGHGNPCPILAWRIPWTESLVGYSPQGGKESDRTEAT